MGAENLAPSYDDIHGYNPPIFVTATTSKAYYSENLKGWEKTMANIGEVDLKAKGFCKSIGFVICMRCNTTAR